VRLYRQALSVGGEEIGETDRSQLELALAAALHRSGDLPGSQETAAGVGRRAERRRDRGWLARTALVMEATGVPEWDGEICRICEQALAREDLPDDLRGAGASTGHILRFMPERPPDAAWLKLDAEPGLCGACRHAKLNETRRGTAYLRCTRAAWDSTLSRYPRLPVTQCEGYERREEKP
jgi:hypothetical protein